MHEKILEAATAELMVEFRNKADSVAGRSDLWALKDFLHEKRKDFDDLVDYRYSRLPFVFAWAIRTGHLDEEALTGLSEEKLQIIRSLAGK